MANLQSQTKSENLSGVPFLHSSHRIKRLEAAWSGHDGKFEHCARVGADHHADWGARVHDLFCGKPFAIPFFVGGPRGCQQPERQF